MKAFRTLLSCVVVAAIAIANAAAQTITPEQKTEILTELEKVLYERAFVPGIDLKKWPEHLAKQKEEIDKAEQQQDFVRAVNRALRGFGFSHVSLRTPVSRERRVTNAVIGVGLTARKEGEALIVTAITPKGPADEAGIKVGDQITMVDGKVPESANVLGGDKDTEVAIKLKNATGEEKELKLKRTPISLRREETLTWIGEDTAVLRIWTFSTGYSQTNVEKLMKEASKAKHLVVDLRSNGGGAVNNLRHLLSLLMPADTTIGTFIGRQQMDTYVKEKSVTEPALLDVANWSDRKYKTRKLEVEPFKGKIAVLINRGSASASEICACALKEVLGSQVIGAKSAGAVLASVYGRLPHGFEIQYPVQDYVSVKGIRLEGNPVVPDAEVAPTAPGQSEPGKDPVLDKAIELLKASK